MKTIEEFLAERPSLVATVARIPMRPGTDPAADTWGATARHFVVEIARHEPGCNPRRMATFYSQGSAVKDPPTLADVLGALASDATAADQTFAGWCDDMGLNADSLADRRTYEECVRIASDLRRVLGAADFRTLLSEVEPL